MAVVPPGRARAQAAQLAAVEVAPVFPPAAPAAQVAAPPLAWATLIISGQKHCRGDIWLAAAGAVHAAVALAHARQHRACP